MLESLQEEQQNNINLNMENFFRQERDLNDFEVENSELVDRAIEDDLSVHNLLDKKYFFRELKKIKQQFFNGSIAREEYKYRKRNLYTERAIQKSVQIFSSAEQFLLDDRDISSEDLAEKIKQYASESNLTLSVDQKWMIDRVSKILDERRQVVVDLLDEVKKILPEDIDVPQSLAGWDNVINESLELKLFILNKSEYLFASSAKNEAIKEMTRATKDMTIVMEEFLATDGAYNHELYIEHGNRLEALRQMELAMYNNELKAFRLSEIHKELVPSTVREYFENILHNVKVSFDEKPLVLVVTVFAESLWRDATRAGGFIPVGDNPGQYEGITIDAQDIEMSAEEVSDVKGHEWSHFLEDNFYKVVRKEYEQKGNIDYAESTTENNGHSIGEKDLWDSARDELNAYLRNNGKILEGRITPLLTTRILDALESDENLRSAAETLKVVHDRIIFLLSLGYNSKDIANTIYAARDMEEAYIALFSDYKIDVNNLSVQKSDEFFRFLRPDDLISSLRYEGLLDRFCQGIPSVSAIKFMYDSTPEKNKEQLFELLKESYDKLKNGDIEISQEINYRYMLIVIARRAKYINEQLEKTEGLLKEQLQEIYQQKVLEIKDFSKETEVVQKSFFDEWIKPIHELEEMLPDDKKISLSMRHFELWKSFSNEDKKEVYKLFILRNFTEGEGLGICMDAVDRYNKEKELGILGDDNLNTKLLKMENSDFLGRLVFFAPEVNNWSEEKLTNIQLAYMTLKIEMPSVDHFTIAAFIIGNYEILSEKKNLLSDVVGGQSFDKFGELEDHWTLNISSRPYFKRTLLDSDEIFIKNNTEIPTATMAKFLAIVHDSLRTMNYFNGNKISGSESFGLVLIYKKEIVQGMLIPGKISRVINSLIHSKYNIYNGEKLTGFAEVDNFFGELLADATL